MIAWLQPAALWGLALVAVPFVIHLLRTRRAPTVSFPSIQFVRESPVAAVRVGPPSDLLLLLLRAAIVALAVLALAQPLALTQARLDAWNARVARAIVVDRSESMRRATQYLEEVAAAEAATAVAAIRIEASDLGEGLRRAARWLESAPPARREVVVVSDFHLGSFDDAAARALPEGVGLRLVPAGSVNSSVEKIAGLRLLSAPGIDERGQDVRIGTDGTESAVTANPAPAQSGLRILSGAAGDERPLLRAVARAGTPAPSPERPIVMRFANAPAAEQIESIRARWMIETIAALEANAEIRRLARELVSIKLPPSEAWTVLMRDRDGAPLVRAAAVGHELIVDSAVPASSYFAAVVLRTALIANRGPVGSLEQEVLRIEPQRLSAWNRTPAPVGAEVWRYAESSDARWCWLGVLALLGIEQWARRRRPAIDEEYRAAA